MPDADPRLDESFADAAAAATSLSRDPGNEVKLRLYALYKQATAGDVRGRRPGFIDPVGRAKYDAWSAVSGTAPDDAKRAYVALVSELASGA
ncbi:MAG TPA: acyl-CoA-binding protein [Kineosporiaceae bacterium]|nr:acyl-CoA-binding protein [Kineosporiaceae bacterium]